MTRVRYVELMFLVSGHGDRYVRYVHSDTRPYGYYGNLILTINAIQREANRMFRS